MNDDGRTPSPDFNRSRYERPNKDWICGHACEGCPCRIGPSHKGECRATTECKPQLQVLPGETKGTWRCTRPKEWGGTCEIGPNPDGTCCKTIPKCQPVRSLRNKRGLVVRGVIAASIAGLLIALTGPARDSFINPGTLSSHHTGPEFEKMAASVTRNPGQGCVACHHEASNGLARWTRAAFRAGKGSLQFANLVSDHPKDFTRMDATCIACHKNESFHEANVPRETACSVCHMEHKGGGPLPAVAMQNCTDCHGDIGQMAEADRKGRGMPHEFFAKVTMPGTVQFAIERPAAGFTKVIQSFAKDHPDFLVNRAQVSDTDTLAFNHARHLTGDIPLLNGKRLDCASCHQVDTSGAFMRPVSFEQNCRACHSLQFDERNPTMQLPHGDATYVRAYLRSLPVQYAQHATRDLGITSSTEVDNFVKEQMANLRTRVRTGEMLEQQVFFSGGKKTPATGISGLDGSGRASFAGCAYCHEVTPKPGSSVPEITPPAMPDRWMPHARFNHSKHVQVDCTKCHSAERSQLTSDIIMPTQQSCVECHSPKGGVNFSCTECHNYHNTPPAAWRDSPSK
ncbi:MAG: hypothetical protein JWM32_383 [Verrucomicrobia bacterium]|nr:hypothetical protein [Verrucomicrobiota bacterium]